MNEQLSQHFSLFELTHSEVAARLGIENDPDDTTVGNLRALCTDILEPLRNSLGRAIFVSSGYRSRMLNTSIGGANASDHLLGLAADIVVPGLSVDDVARGVLALSPFVPLKQCIVEFSRWVHVSRLPPESPVTRRPDFLVASLNERGKTVYSPWDA